MRVISYKMKTILAKPFKKNKLQTQDIDSQTEAWNLKKEESTDSLMEYTEIKSNRKWTN